MSNLKHIGHGKLSPEYVLSDAMDYVKSNKVKSVFIVFVLEDEAQWPQMSASAFDFGILARAKASFDNYLSRFLRGES